MDVSSKRYGNRLWGSGSCEVKEQNCRVQCIVGGALLVVAGTTGMKSLLEEILKYIQPTVDASPIFATIVTVLIFIAALGGIFVIIGGLLILHVPRIGKLLVMLGAGLGLVGFMIP